MRDKRGSGSFQFSATAAWRKMKTTPDPSEDSQIRPDPHRTQADVQIGKANPAQAHPGEEHVPAVERRDARVAGAACRPFGEAIAAAPDQMPQRMAAEGVQAEQHDID